MGLERNIHERSITLGHNNNNNNKNDNHDNNNLPLGIEIPGWRSAKGSRA